MTTKHPPKILRITLIATVYDKVYGMHDVEHLVAIFNDIHHQSMKLAIRKKTDGKGGK